MFIEVEGLSLLREAAVFRCQHQSPDANVIWSVNGSSVGQFSAVIPSSIFENGSLLYTLTIPARLEYNGTVVVCLAFFFDGSPTESTSPATLIFRTGLSKIVYLIVTIIDFTQCLESWQAISDRVW